MTLNNLTDTIENNQKIFLYHIPIEICKIVYKLIKISDKNFVKSTNFLLRTHLFRKDPASITLLLYNIDPFENNSFHLFI